MPILLDDGEVADLYGVSQLPQTFLIDPTGMIVKKYLGPRDWLAKGIHEEIFNLGEKR